MAVRKFADATGITELWSKVKSYISNAISGKQDTLVSGTNIKTVNGNSLLGSGDLPIQSGSKNVWYVSDGTVSSNQYILTTTTGDFSASAGNVLIWTPQWILPNAVSDKEFVIDSINVGNPSIWNADDVYSSFVPLTFVYVNTAAFTGLMETYNTMFDYFKSTEVTQVSITVANWNATTTCTKSVTGVTASNSIIVSPAPSSISDYVSAGVYCSAQGSGTLTFNCTSTPTADLVVNVMIVG